MKRTLIALSLSTSVHAAMAAPSFALEESTISSIHAAMKEGRTSCSALVDAYLARIAAYDKKGPALNAVLVINPEARKLAAEKDAEFRKTGKLSGPLHCIPVAAKDNYNTTDMPTTAGSEALKGLTPKTESTVTRKLREAGAIILMKTNMHELALAGVTVSSLGGQTRNPYDLNLTPGGSSGGTGVALAANFATIGLGSDTVNSIRSPASANSLVGLRPSVGLVSRAGVVPVSDTQDAVGPITRTVHDAAVMLDTIAGYDSADIATARSTGHIPSSYTTALDANGLKGARIGVLKTLFGNGPEHQEVNRTMATAIDAMKKAGATVVEIDDPAFDANTLIADYDVQKWEFKTLFNAYLQSQGDAAPVKSLSDLLASGKYHKPSLEKFLTATNSVENPRDQHEYLARLAKLDKLRDRLLARMAEQNVEALVYPLQKRLVVPIGEMNQADRNGILAAMTGFPAITVPAGFSQATAQAPLGVPVGMDMIGRPFSEITLLKLAYAFEQTTHVRKAPLSTPALK